MGIAKAAPVQRLRRVNRPIVNDDRKLWNLRFGWVCNNQRAIKPPCNLFPSPVVRMIPVGAWILQFKGNVCVLAGSNGFIALARYTVILVWHAQSVPMNGRGFRQVILNRDVEHVPLDAFYQGLALLIHKPPDLACPR